MGKYRSERRHQRRYVVAELEATINDLPCSIVDISRTGVRLTRPANLDVGNDDVTICFRTEAGPLPGDYTVTGTFVRSTPMDVVYRYAPPTPRWESLLRALDTFHLTRLDPIDL